MNNLLALGLTLLIGIFFILGFAIVHFVKKKKELTIFATGMAFIVMLGMLFFDLVPEMAEMSNSLDNIAYPNLYILLFVIAGVALLKVLDVFVPHHKHEHTSKEDIKEHNEHMYHIGFITSLSLILHNILEGMSVFIIACENIMSGFMTSIAIGCHNLPLGIEIASSMENQKKSKGKYVTLFFLIFSSAIGASILYLLGESLPDTILVVFVAIACGMILYITLGELLGEIYNYRKEKYVYYGMGVGLLITIIMTLL